MSPGRKSPYKRGAGGSPPVSQPGIPPTARLRGRLDQVLVVRGCQVCVRACGEHVAGDAANMPGSLVQVQVARQPSARVRNDTTRYSKYQRFSTASPL